MAVDDEPAAKKNALSADVVNLMMIAGYVWSTSWMYSKKKLGIGRLFKVGLRSAESLRLAQKAFGVVEIRWIRWKPIRNVHDGTIDY